MRKTLLAALITTATAFSLPTFAQVNLGGAAGAAGQVGADAPVGNALPSTLPRVDNRTGVAIHRAGQKTRSLTRNSMHAAQSATRQDAGANLDANASAHASAAGIHGGADASTHQRAELNPSSATDKAGQMGRRGGDQVRGNARSAIHSSDHIADSVGKSVKGVKAAGSAQGHVHTRANTDMSTHGH